MTQARSRLVSVETTPYYHCVCRCVRRAFLCGDDPFSGGSYEHRRQWIVDRMATLLEVFCIDIAAYAVMSNHYHVLVHLDPERAQALSATDVVERWCTLFSAPLLIERFQAGEALSAAERAAVDELIGRWRDRLADLSWFMRCLNEYIARRANAEDQCKGRFWEGRYKSQALLDEAAVLSCMTYIDLNPIRAGMAETPEGSDYTAIQARIRKTQPLSEALMPFLGAEKAGQESGLVCDERDYLALVDWTGRSIRNDKRGAIPSHLAPILVRLGIESKEWTQHVQHFGRRYYRAIGALQRLRQFAEKIGQGWFQGQSRCRVVFQPAME